MSHHNPPRSCQPLGPARAETRSVQDIEDALAGMVRSDDPAVVLSSLARCSSPSFSDACSLQLSVGVDDLFQICFPLQDEHRCAAGAESAGGGAHPQRSAGEAIRTGFRAASGSGYPAFAGVIVHSWAGRRPAENDRIIARLLVDRAVAIVQEQRLVQSAALTDERAAKLALELVTSRTEAEAIGILMATHQATRAEAIRLLRQMTRAGDRQLDDVAADIVHAANLRRSPVTRASSAGHQHLQMAAWHGRAVATDPPEDVDPQDAHNG
jgi:hypothetical protein